MTPRKLMRQVQSVLTDDLLSPKYKRHRRELPWLAHPMFGHCYVAAEALYHLLGRDKRNWVPVCCALGKGATHWWLEHRRTGRRLDPTRAQFEHGFLRYPLGRRRGFLTKRPSRRARIVIRRVRALLA